MYFWKHSKLSRILKYYPANLNVVKCQEGGDIVVLKVFVDRWLIFSNNSLENMLIFHNKKMSLKREVSASQLYV